MFHYGKNMSIFVAEGEQIFGGRDEIWGEPNRIDLHSKTASPAERAGLLRTGSLVVDLILRFDRVGNAHRELEGIVFGGRLGRRRVIEVAVQCAHGEAEIFVSRKRESVGFIG